MTTRWEYLRLVGPVDAKRGNLQFRPPQPAYQGLLGGWQEFGDVPRPADYRDEVAGRQYVSDVAAKRARFDDGLDGVLQALGADGWELVQQGTSPWLGGQGDGQHTWTLFFRRPYQ